ncbi:MAG: hypothetical protein HGA36_01805 [Candidatus Moranbacteria bacterium]|nr:hypothetical protein [Candidatus Moranbacteria bacterium]
MDRNELREKLSKKFPCHDVVTAMSAIPADTKDITPEVLHNLLVKGRFHPHEITTIRMAVFN